MPIVRIDVPQGHPREEMLRLKRCVEEAIARTWATDHIYVAIHEMLCESDDRSAILTVDLRAGRGREEKRAAVLYQMVLDALKASLNTDADRFVLLVREFPESSFIVDGGRPLPP